MRESSRKWNGMEQIETYMWTLYMGPDHYHAYMHSCIHFCNNSDMLCFQEFVCDPLKLAKAKLSNKPETAALKLMDCFFSTEEMVNCNPSGVTKSRDVMRQKTIKMLEPSKMKCIDGMLVFICVSGHCVFLACVHNHLYIYFQISWIHYGRVRILVNQV